MILRRDQRLAMLAAVVLSSAAMFAALVAPSTVAGPYLAAFLILTAIPLGGSALLMLLHVSGGAWADPVRGVLEAMAAWAPSLLLFIAPLFVLAPHLYPWAAPDAHASAYFLPSFVALRAFLIVVLWAVGGAILSSASERVPRGTRAGAGLRAGCAVGLILYVLSMTGAAADWFGSLHAHWHSSMFAVILICAQGLAALALLSLIASAVLPHDQRLLTDCGNLLLAFTLLHAYVSFSQFFIIWNGNVPDRTSWYVDRTRGWWLVAITFCAFTQFAIPFTMMLFRTLKSNPVAISIASCSILIGTVVEASWIILPSSTSPDIASFIVLAVITVALLAPTFWTFAQRAIQSRTGRPA